MAWVCTIVHISCTIVHSKAVHNSPRFMHDGARFGGARWCTNRAQVVTAWLSTIVHDLGNMVHGLAVHNGAEIVHPLAKPPVVTKMLGLVVHNGVGLTGSCAQYGPYRAPVCTPRPCTIVHDVCTIVHGFAVQNSAQSVLQCAYQLS